MSRYVGVGLLDDVDNCKQINILSKPGTSLARSSSNQSVKRRAVAYTSIAVWRLAVFSMPSSVGPFHLRGLYWPVYKNWTRM